MQLTPNNIGRSNVMLDCIRRATELGWGLNFVSTSCHGIAEHRRYNEATVTINIDSVEVQR